MTQTAQVQDKQDKTVLAEHANYIGGQWVRTQRLFDKIDPTTGRVTAHIHEAGRDEVNQAVAAARKALKGPWAHMSNDERVRLLHAFADRIEECQAEFVEAEISDTGMPLSFAEHVDIPRGAANFRVFADLFTNVSTEAFNEGGCVTHPARRPLRRRADHAASARGPRSDTAVRRGEVRLIERAFGLEPDALTEMTDQLRTLDLAA
nr:B359 [uncultured bacterium]